MMLMRYKGVEEDNCHHFEKQYIFDDTHLNQNRREKIKVVQANIFTLIFIGFKANRFLFCWK